MGHNVGGYYVVKFKNVVYHFLLTFFNNALFLADIDKHSDFFLGDRLRCILRIDSEKTQHSVCRCAEKGYNRTHNCLKKQKYANHSERNTFGIMHGNSLRQQFAENKRKIRN